jgi:hypothetical protein
MSASVSGKKKRSVKCAINDGQSRAHEAHQPVTTNAAIDKKRITTFNTMEASSDLLELLKLIVDTFNRLRMTFTIAILDYIHAAKLVRTNTTTIGFELNLFEASKPRRFMMSLYQKRCSSFVIDMLNYEHTLKKAPPDTIQGVVDAARMHIPSVFPGASSLSDQAGLPTLYLTHFQKETRRQELP